MNAILAKEYTEVLEVLKYVEPKYVKKIPKKMLASFERNKDKEYVFKISSEIPLKNQKLMKGTLEILALLNIKYWCESQEEKNRLIQKYMENDIKYQNMYSMDKIFQEKKNYINKVKEIQEIKWYQKVINKIKTFFK